MSSQPNRPLGMVEKGGGEREKLRKIFGDIDYQLLFFHYNIHIAYDLIIVHAEINICTGQTRSVAVMCNG